MWGQTCSGKTLAYNPTGSGAGVDQFIAKQVDFAGSDSALADDQTAKAAERCGGNPAWNLPLVFGPVAMAYNVEGVDKLTVNADVLAKIFQGQIKKWNDPAIAALNSGATLPDADIKPIYRSDSSGTTDNFQKYLAAAAPQSWTKGAGKEFQGGAGEGAQKSSGVVQAIQATPGSIGYVEKSPAAAAGLTNRGHRQRSRRGRPERRRPPRPRWRQRSSRPTAWTWRWIWTRCTRARKPASTR